MRWKGREKSKNVIDRRGAKGPAIVGGGILGILVLVASLFFGPDVAKLLQPVAQQQQQQNSRQTVGKDDEAKEFVSVVLRDTEKVWTKILADPKQIKKTRQYKPPKLELFSDRVHSACGAATSAVGPFYCSADEKIYIDPTFFEELRRRHRAPGDFAAAYVIAHEVAHHVQHLLGYSKLVRDRRAKSSKIEGNRWSVRLELQADFLAGVWAHHIAKTNGRKILEEGDLEEAINAANQIGDDTISKGRLTRDHYTHGSSKQRVKYFTMGFKSGRLADAHRLFEVNFEDL